MTFLFQEWVLENICGHYRDDFNHETAYEHVSNSPGSVCIQSFVTLYGFPFPSFEKTAAPADEEDVPLLQNTEVVRDWICHSNLDSHKKQQARARLWTYQRSIGISDPMAVIVTMSYQHAFWVERVILCNKKEPGSPKGFASRSENLQC